MILYDGEGGMMMKPIKRLSAADYDHIFELSQFAFQYTLSKEERKQKQEEAQRHVIWGVMDGGQIAAKLHLIPLSCYINGQPFEMGGISSVATWPEYRRKGYAKELLHHVLIQMRKKGQTISFLHPFSVPFYRKFGWEVVFTNKKYELPLDCVRKKWNGKGYVERVGKEIPLLQSIYSAFAKGYTGMLVRDEKWWEQRVFQKKWEVVVAKNTAQEAEGYIIYKVAGNELTIKEIVCKTNNGRKLLLEFIGNHDSMAEKVHVTVPENDPIPLLIDEPRFTQIIKPYFMARIVDVWQFLKRYPYEKWGCEQSASVILHVEDSFLPENNGLFQLKRTGEGVSVDVVKDVTKAEEKLIIHCSIQWLTAMFLGYKRPKELAQLSFIQGEMSTIDHLEQFIAKQQPFFADFF